MDIASMSVMQHMASLQQAISVTMLDKTMNQGSSEMTNLLVDFQEANPASSVTPPSNHLLDTYA